MAASAAQAAYEAWHAQARIPADWDAYSKDSDYLLRWEAAAQAVRDHTGWGTLIPPHEAHLESAFCPAGCPRLEAVRALLRDRALRPAVNEVSNRQRSELGSPDRLERLLAALPGMREAIEAFDQPELRRIALDALILTWNGDNR